MKELLSKLKQLQYEIGILDIDEERLTAVDVRTKELEELISQGQELPIHNVSNSVFILCENDNHGRDLYLGTYNTKKEAEIIKGRDTTMTIYEHEVD